MPRSSSSPVRFAAVSVPPRARTLASTSRTDGASPRSSPSNAPALTDAEPRGEAANSRAGSSILSIHCQLQVEDLLLLGALDGKIVLGSMNRGGLRGAEFELDDRLTGYTASAITEMGFEGGKMLLRIDLD